MSSSKSISGRLIWIQEHRLAHDIADVVSSITGFGMRAKAENSSTMRPMSPTWRMMVSVHWSKISRSSVIDVAVFAAQALGRKLDRRQRVLDLVRDAPGDVGPGRACAGR